MQKIFVNAENICWIVGRSGRVWYKYRGAPGSGPVRDCEGGAAAQEVVAIVWKHYTLIDFIRTQDLKYLNMSYYASLRSEEIASFSCIFLIHCCNVLSWQ